MALIKQTKQLIDYTVDCNLFYGMLSADAFYGSLREEGVTHPLVVLSTEKKRAKIRSLLKRIAPFDISIIEYGKDDCSLENLQLVYSNGKCDAIIACGNQQAYEISSALCRTLSGAEPYTLPAGWILFGHHSISCHQVQALVIDARFAIFTDAHELASIACASFFDLTTSIIEAGHVFMESMVSVGLSLLSQVYTTTKANRVATQNGQTATDILYAEYCAGLCAQNRRTTALVHLAETLVVSGWTNLHEVKAALSLSNLSFLRQEQMQTYEALTLLSDGTDPIELAFALISAADFTSIVPKIEQLCRKGIVFMKNLHAKEGVTPLLQFMADHPNLKIQNGELPSKSDSLRRSR
ncbi:MAG: hypothetical protein RBT04_03105 [Sphaerochaetaceae bacterium]|nr:hypothetical protein [Sphaerochaetaceae bacterium]